MEFTIDRSSLLTSLEIIQGVITRRSTVPILTHALFKVHEGNLHIAATDLTIGVTTSLACDSGRLPTNQFTLQARKLFEIVREAPEEKIAIETSVADDWIYVRSGRAKFKMIGLDPRSFPALHEQKTEAFILTLQASALAIMIDRTLFAVSADEARYNLSGIYLEASDGAIRLVATDGHRLSLIERESDLTIPGVIIPRAGMVEMRKLLDLAGDTEVTLRIDKESVSIKHNTTELMMRLVEGEFPDFRGVIPKSPRYEIAISRDAFLNSIKRAVLFSGERYHGIKLTLADNTLTISSTSPEMGEASDTIDVRFAGEAFSVGFNAVYLQQALSALPEGSEILLRLSDDVSPGMIGTSADEKFLHVIMPMRL